METKNSLELFQETVYPYITPEFLAWLKDNRFFELPASTHFHGNHDGGLFQHSYEVMMFLVNATERMGISWQNKRSPYIVGMFHDLCKIESYTKHLDYSSTWTYNEKQIIPGHGDKSILYLPQFMTLTEEEVYCIRFHMGPPEEEQLIVGFLKDTAKCFLVGKEWW